MAKQTLPPLPDSAPECNREDGLCPIFPMHYQQETEKGLGKLGRTIANLLRKGSKPDEESIGRVEKDAAGHSITGQFLLSEIKKRQASGELCSICPYKERR